MRVGNGNKFVAYYRVSTQKQGRSGLGLAAQKQSVVGYLSSHGGELVAEFTEVESGKRDDRPVLQRALAACRLRNATLVVAKLDRLARRALTILQMIESSDVEFVALDHPQASKLTITIFAAIAEDEAARISARTCAALAEVRRKGEKPLGGHPERLTIAAKRKGAEASAAARAEGAAKFAQDLGPIIRELCPHAKSLREIAGCLNAHGWPAPRGGEWSAVQVQRVLSRLAG